MLFVRMTGLRPRFFLPVWWAPHPPLYAVEPFFLGFPNNQASHPGEDPGSIRKGSRIMLGISGMTAMGVDVVGPGKLKITLTGFHEFFKVDSCRRAFAIIVLIQVIFQQVLCAVLLQ